MRRLLAAAALAVGTITAGVGIAALPAGTALAHSLWSNCDEWGSQQGDSEFVTTNLEPEVTLAEGGDSAPWPDGVTKIEGQFATGEYGKTYKPKDCDEDTTTTTEAETTTTEAETTTTEAETTTTAAETTTTAGETTTTAAETTTTTTVVIPPPDTTVPGQTIVVYTCADFGTNYDLAEQWRVYYVSIGRADLAAGLTGCRPTSTTGPGLPATGPSPYAGPMIAAGACLGLAGTAMLVGTRRRKTS